MKYSECDARQKKAYKNIKFAAEDLIGGLENTLMDYPEDDEWYIDAQNQLNDHDGLVKTVYENALEAVYDEGFCCFNRGAKQYLKDIRFCGKEWLMERCEARVKQLGY